MNWQEIGEDSITRSLYASLNIAKCDQMKEDEIGETYSKNGINENFIENLGWKI
jgi:hypothetical protein